MTTTQARVLRPVRAAAALAPSVFCTAAIAHSFNVGEIAIGLRSRPQDRGRQTGPT
jgi:hypothetical protein